jgi:molecular chaperone GrpE
MDTHQHDDPIKETQDESSDVVFEDEDVAPAERAKKLRKALVDEQEKSRQLLTELQRAKADFINMRKRDEDEKAAVRKYAAEPFVMSVLSALDAYDMAAKDGKYQELPETWKQGFASIMGTLVSSLEKAGAQSFSGEGESFDPARHEAISSVQVEAGRDGVVVAVAQKGWLLHDKVIRPAKVIVGVTE